MGSDEEGVVKDDSIPTHKSMLRPPYKGNLCSYFHLSSCVASAVERGGLLLFSSCLGSSYHSVFGVMWELQ